MKPEAKTEIAVEILKELIKVRGVVLEADGLDESIVEQAFKYASLVERKYDSEQEERYRAAKAAAAAHNMHNAAFNRGIAQAAAYQINPPITVTPTAAAGGVTNELLGASRHDEAAQKSLTSAYDAFIGRFRK